MIYTQLRRLLDIESTREQDFREDSKTFMMKVGTQLQPLLYKDRKNGFPNSSLIINTVKFLRYSLTFFPTLVCTELH